MAIDPEKAKHILEACAAALAGHDRNLQGVVLADLLAMWLAASTDETPLKTFKLREGLLNEHIRMVVQELLPKNEAILAAKRTLQERKDLN
jgi:hypothetical protein